MIRDGLVSITFRQLTPRAIVALVARAGLAGGDVHVPHGQVATAREVARMTQDAGLVVAAYGSYYRVGVSEADGLAFEQVLETAAALVAPTVRVWAGTHGSADADAGYRAAVTEDARRIAGLAQGAGISISFEYHRGTLADTNASAQRLLQEVAHPNVYTCWQPPVAEPPAYCLSGLDAIAPRLTNVHVFHWLAETPTAAVDRRPLAEGAGLWRQYLARVAATGRDHFALIEFVRGDEPEQLLVDAHALKTWLAEIG